MLAGVAVLALVGAGAYGMPRLSPAPHGSPVAPPVVARVDAVVGPVTAAASPGAAAPVATPQPRAVRQTSTPARPSAAPVKVPATGPGTYRMSDVRAEPATERGRLYRVDVRVERGLDVDANAVARTIAETLNDERSWGGTGRYRFQLVGAGEQADLHAYVATPGTTDRLCYPLLTRGELSCRAGSTVVLNAKRWVRGAPAYGRDVSGYRQYLINHEFGHALGRGHVGCPGRGRTAPVMLQQTKGLDGCRRNPWPSPTRD